MSKYVMPAIVAAAFSWSAALSAQVQLPQDVYGSYAPAGDCRNKPYIIVNQTGVHLDTLTGKRGPLTITVSYTWIGGATYDGIQTWALVHHGGKDRWGEDHRPVILTFNAKERRGVLTVERTGAGNERPVSLDGPLSSIVKASSFERCKTGAVIMQPPATTAAKTQPAAGAPAKISQSAASDFVSVVKALMQPVSVPEYSYYDWRFIEKAPHVKWAALPPEMLDKPLTDGHFFRRNGLVTAGGQQIKVMAAGARSMVFNHYFKNEGKALGETAVISALRSSGMTVTTARCAINKNMQAPTWYRISGSGKRTALLWIAQPRGAGSPWEGFNLSLDASLKPLTAQESKVYTDRCG